MKRVLLLRASAGHVSKGNLEETLAGLVLTQLSNLGARETLKITFAS